MLPTSTLGMLKTAALTPLFFVLNTSRSLALPTSGITVPSAWMVRPSIMGGSLGPGSYGTSTVAHSLPSSVRTLIRA
jgi:hypothetical protein